MSLGRARSLAMLAVLVQLVVVGSTQVVAQSPSPGSVSVANVGRPLTIQELDETRIAVAMTGDQAVVVADATVATEKVDADPACDLATTACPYGRLLGLATDDVIMVRARSDVAALYPDGVSGPLALRLAGSNIELLGVLDLSAGYAPAATQSAFPDPDARPVGTLVAVDGWLQLLGWGVPCPPPMGGLTDDSPFVRCPGGWITPDDAAPPETETSIPLGPGGFGIPVQANAYAAFASDARPTTDHIAPPRQGIYVLKRVGNPLIGGEPASGWLVIARLDTIE